MTLAELYRELERHDWFHAMSDSAEVHERGDANWNRLHAEAAKTPEGLHLMKDYAKHVFSGEAYGTPKHPKPEKPAEADMWVCTADRPFNLEQAKALGITRVFHPSSTDKLCPICKMAMNREMV